MGHTELSALRSSRPNILLLGDVPADAAMVAGSEEVIRIRVLDPRRGEVHAIADALQASFDAGYDLVTEHSLEPVVKILEDLVATT
jgi:hypothetical protein